MKTKDIPQVPSNPMGLFAILAEYGNLKCLSEQFEDIDKATNYYEKALETLEFELNDYDPLLESIYGELSRLFEEKGDIPNAIAYEERVSDYIQECTTEYSDESAESFIHLAELYRMNDDLYKAETNYMKALRNYTLNKPHENENIPQVYFELSTICAERGDHEKAREYLENAYADSVKIHGEDDEVTLYIKEYLDKVRRLDV